MLGTRLAAVRRAFWIANVNDPLSRVTAVILADNQTIQTTYIGTMVMETD
jgi:hypothetical protein